MVVPPFCPGAIIEVLVDGEPLPEYDDPDPSASEPNTVTKYIEAKSDAEFAIDIKFTDDFRYPASDIEAQVLLDTKSMRRNRILATMLFDTAGQMLEGRPSQITPDTCALQRYRFGALSIGQSMCNSVEMPTNLANPVENDSIDVGQEFVTKLSQVGTITVALRSIHNIRRISSPTSEFMGNEDLG